MSDHPEAPARRHQQLAVDCWRMICALGDDTNDVPTLHRAAEHLIEMACDSAVESERRREGLPPSITCPKCGLTSYNPNDIREGYCGHCHEFWREGP